MLSSTDVTSIVKTIAIFRIGQLGDTLVALPAITSIRTRYPHARFVLITNRHQGKGFVSSWELLGPMGIFSEVIFYLPGDAGLKGLLSQVACLRVIRRLAPEVLFYLVPDSRPPWRVARDRFFFQTLCGIHTIYGMEPKDHDPDSRDKHGRLLRAPAEVDRLLSIVAQADVAIPVPGQAVWNLPIGDQERRKVDRLWQEASVSTKEPIIAIGLGSKMPAKRWPVDRFIALGRRLVEAYPEARLLIIGDSEDEGLGEQICLAIGTQVINWAGRLTVLESAEVLRRCTLYVGNDTGVMHLAAVMGARCIAVFSARDHPGRWHPYGAGHVVLRKDVPCAGCMLTVCEEHEMRCLKEITVDEVYEACLQVVRTHHSITAAVDQC